MASPHRSIAVLALGGSLLIGVYAAGLADASVLVARDTRVQAGWSAPPEATVSAPARLSEADARYYMGVALHRRFKTVWDYAAYRRVRCGARLTPYKRRCRITFVIGDSAFYGKGVIAFRTRNGVTRWYYGYDILRVNEYCLIVQNRPFSECTTRFKERL